MQARSGLTAKNGTAMTQGRVQVYTGDGKGKTTAALGLVLRASGHGLRSYVGQFMKGQDYGELTALENEPLITVQQYGKEGCIRKADVTEEHRDQARRYRRAGRDQCGSVVRTGADHRCPRATGPTTGGCRVGVDRSPRSGGATRESRPGDRDEVGAALL